MTNVRYRLYRKLKNSPFEGEFLNSVLDVTDLKVIFITLIMNKNNFPKTIYFCNKTLDGIQIYANNWKRLNPHYEIILYDDKMCEEFLFNTFGKLHLDIFKFLKDGPIKADFWRLCILYIYGGVYSDIDNEPFVPIDDFIEPGIDFLTCSSYWDKYTFNPNFIISNKNNPILEKCIIWYINKYTNNEPYNYWKWSIMQAFKDTLFLDGYKNNEGIFTLNNFLIQILKECKGKTIYDDYNTYNNITIFNNRYKSWDCHTHCFYRTDYLNPAVPSSS